MAPIRLPKLNRSRDGANPFMRFFSPPEVTPAWGPIVPWTQELDLNAPIDHSGSTESPDGFFYASPSASLSRNEGGDSSAWPGSSNEDGEVPSMASAPPAPLLHTPISGIFDSGSMANFSYGALSNPSTILSSEDGVDLPTLNAPAILCASNSSFGGTSSANIAASAFTPSNTDWTTVQMQRVVDTEAAALPVITLPTVPAVLSVPLCGNLSPASTPAFPPSSCTPSDSSLVAPYQLQFLHSTFGRKGSRRSRKNPGPPKPRNPFMLFRSYQSQQHSREMEIKRSMGIRVEKTHQPDISKGASAKWENLSPQERKSWEDLAREEKRLHMIAYPDYKYPSSKSAKGRKSAKDGEQKKGVAASGGVVHHESSSHTHGRAFGYNAGPSFDRTNYPTSNIPMPTYGSFGTSQEF